MHCARVLPSYGSKKQAIRGVSSKGAPAMEFVSRRLAQALPPRSSSAPDDPDDDFKKLLDAYYLRTTEFLSRPGERLQLITPYMMVTNPSDPSKEDDIVLQLTDVKPNYALIEGPSAPSGIVPTAAEPGNGYYSAYSNLIGWLDSGRTDYVREMESQSKGSNLHWKKFLKSRLSSPTYELLKEFVETAEEDTFLDPDRITNAWFQDTVRLPTKAITRLAEFKKTNPTSDQYYGRSYKDIEGQMSLGEGKSFAVSHERKRQDMSNTWAKGEYELKYNLFSSSGSVEYSQFAKQICSNKMTMDVKMKVLNIPVRGSYGGWYWQPLVDNALADKTAFNPDDNPEGRWNECFQKQGTNGTKAGALVYSTESLVLATEVTIVMAVTTSMSEEESKKLQAAVDVGYWPFFRAKGGYSDSKVTLDNDGNTLTITTTTPKGSIFVVGRKVADVHTI